MREIRPFLLSEALDVALDVLTSNARLFGALAVAIYVVPLVPIYVLVDAATTDDPESLAGLFTLPPILVLHSLLVATLSVAVADDFLEARPRVSRALHYGLRAVWRLFIASMCVGLPVVSGMALAVGLGVGGGALIVDGAADAVLIGGALVGAGVVILAATVFVMAGLLLYTPIVVLENRAAIDSLRRCWSLMRGRRRRVVGLVLLWMLLGTVPALVLEWLLPGGIFVTAVTTAVVEALVTTYIAIAEVVLYLDARARSEAFDVEQLARVVEGNLRAA